MQHLCPGPLNHLSLEILLHNFDTIFTKTLTICSKFASLYFVISRIDSYVPENVSLVSSAMEQSCEKAYIGIPITIFGTSLDVG